MQNFVQGVLAFVKLQPVKKYGSEIEKEFTLDVIVSEDMFDEFGERFPKQSGKTVKTSEFKDTYKIDPPFPDAKKQYVLKLKRPATYKDGNEVDKKYWPKALVLSSEGEAIPLDENILIANGSVGKVSFEEQTNDFGTFARLRNILVETLIEYKPAGGDAGSDFGVKIKHEGSSDFEVVKQNTKQDFEVKQPVASPARKNKVKQAESVEDEDVPW